MAPQTTGSSKSCSCEDKKRITKKLIDKNIEALIDFYKNIFFETKTNNLKASIGINVLHMLMNLKRKVI